jgi:pimeloyl-ACP methyl ester carboxylesterase
VSGHLESSRHHDFTGGKEALLAKQFTVVAVDLRGIGGSAETAGGYDATNMAEDVHQLVGHLHLEHVYVVGHDIGGMVAYAFARPYPETSRGVMMLDAPVPGIGPWDAVKRYAEAREEFEKYSR